MPIQKLAEPIPQEKLIQDISKKYPHLKGRIPAFVKDICSHPILEQHPEFAQNISFFVETANALAEQKKGNAEFFDRMQKFAGQSKDPTSIFSTYLAKKWSEIVFETEGVQEAVTRIQPEPPQPVAQPTRAEPEKPSPSLAQPQRSIETPATPAVPFAPPRTKEEKKQCPTCDAEVGASAAECPECGEKLEPFFREAMSRQFGEGLTDGLTLPFGRTTPRRRGDGLIDEPLPHGRGEEADEEYPEEFERLEEEPKGLLRRIGNGLRRIGNWITRKPKPPEEEQSLEGLKLGPPEQEQLASGKIEIVPPQEDETGSRSARPPELVGLGPALRAPPPQPPSERPRLDELAKFLASTPLPSPETPPVKLTKEGQLLDLSELGITTHIEPIAIPTELEEETALYRMTIELWAMSRMDTKGDEQLRLLAARADNAVCAAALDRMDERQAWTTLSELKKEYERITGSDFVPPQINVPQEKLAAAQEALFWAIRKSIGGTPEEGLLAFDAALRLAPDFAEGWFWKGEVALLKAQEFEEALKSFTRAAELQPDNKTAWFNKGSVLQELGKHDEAKDAFSTALDKDPNYTEAWVRKGNAYLGLGKGKEALECYTRALEVDGSLANRLGLEGFGYSTQWFNDDGSPKEGMVAQLSLALVSKLREDGKRFEEERDIRRALKAYEAALELAPYSSELCYGKGAVLYSMGKPKEALEALGKALDTNPDYADAWSLQGTILYQTKGADKKKALECFDKALTLRIKSLEAKKGQLTGDDAKSIEDCKKKLAEMRKDFSAIAADGKKLEKAVERFGEMETALVDMENRLAAESISTELVPAGEEPPPEPSLELEPQPLFKTYLCSQCGAFQHISESAKSCGVCGAVLEAEAQGETPQPEGLSTSASLLEPAKAVGKLEIECPLCGQKVANDVSKCPCCGTEFDDEVPPPPASEDEDEPVNELLAEPKVEAPKGPMDRKALEEERLKLVQTLEIWGAFFEGLARAKKAELGMESVGKTLKEISQAEARLGEIRNLFAAGHRTAKSSRQNLEQERTDLFQALHELDVSKRTALTLVPLKKEVGKGAVLIEREQQTVAARLNEINKTLAALPEETKPQPPARAAEPAKEKTVQELVGSICGKKGGMYGTPKIEELTPGEWAFLRSKGITAIEAVYFDSLQTSSLSIGHELTYV